MNRARKDVGGPDAISVPRILVVEDEPDLALLLSYNLEAEGYDVETVRRGDEAESRLSELAHDLVILDWMLPGLSGVEICRRLRSRENTRTLPVITVTARREEADRVHGLLVGADDYIVKPSRCQSSWRACARCSDAADPSGSQTVSMPERSNSIGRLGAFSAGRVLSISVQRNSGCSNI